MEVILLTYVNRSGSTLLVSHLDNTNNIMACPEADILVQLFLSEPDRKYSEKQQEYIAELLLKDRKFKNWGIGKLELLNILSSAISINIFIELLKVYKTHVKPMAYRLVFKATGIIRFLPVIEKSRIVKNLSISYLVLVRDPRAIFASQKQIFVPHKGRKMNINPMNTIHQWNYLVKQYFVMKDQVAIKLIKFEDYINDPLGVLSQTASISETLKHGLINPAYYNRIQIEEQAMHLNILKRPISDRIYSWKNELGKIYKDLILYHCFSGMSKLNYADVNVQLSIKLILVKLIYKLDLVQFGIKRFLWKLFLRKNHFKTLKNI